MKYLIKVFLEHFSFGLTIPFSVIWMLERGLSLTEAGMYTAVIFLSTFILEVPTGLVADKFGQKLSISLGIGFHILGLALFALAPNLLIFVISALFTGTGWAFISGAEESYVHDVIAPLEKNSYKKMFAWVSIIDEFSTIIGMIIGSLLVSQVSLQSPFVLSVFIMIVTGVFFVLVLPKDSCMLHDSEVKNKNPVTLLTSLKTYQVFLPTFIALAMLFESARILWQPALIQQGWSVVQLGLIFACFKICSFLGSLTAERVNIDPRMALICAGIIGGIALLGLSSNAMIMGFIALALYSFTENFLRINQSVYLLKIVPNKHAKTTFLSAASLVRNVTSSGLSPLIGFLAVHSIVLPLILLLLLKVLGSILIRSNSKFTSLV